MSLSSDLEDVFTQMKEDSDGDNGTMASGVVNAVATSLETGKTVATVYSGSSSLGSSPGTVLSTSSTIDASAGKSDAEADLKDALDGMNDSADGDNSVWVEAVVEAVSTITTKAKITEALSGTVIPPSPPPPTIPAAGQGKGALNDSAAKSGLQSAIEAIPDAMGDSGDDSILSSMMAIAILTYFTACIGNFEGQGALSGLTGINTIVGNI